MIIRTYHVFGSGHSSVTFYAPPSMTLSEYVIEVDHLFRNSKDDGHNGFVGTVSTTATTPLKTVTKFTPGRTIGRAPAGYVQCPTLQWAKQQIMHYPDCPVGDCWSVKKSQNHV